MSKISIFRNFNEVVENKPVEKILDDIKTGTFKNQIVHLRKCLEANKMIAYEREKKSLLAFTPSGCFEGGRKMELLKSYVPYLVLDFDKIPEDRTLDIRTKITADPFVLACFTSPSGNGLKAIVQTDATAGTHKDHFLLAEEYFEKLTGYPLDKSGKDITRLCFFSYDPDIYINPNPVIFSHHNITKLANTRPDTPTPKPDTSYPIPDTRQWTTDNNLPDNQQPTTDPSLLFEHAIRFTERKIQFVQGSRNIFVHQLACNCNRLGIPETEALSFILSRFNYDEKEVRTTTTSAYKNTLEHGSRIFNSKSNRIKKSAVDLETGEIIELNTETFFSDTGVQPEKKKIPLIDKIENFLNDRYDFRHNVVTGKLEYKLKDRKSFLIINDFQENSLLRELLKNHIKCSFTVLRTILNSDFCYIYNPFEAYFSSLPPYDNETDYINQLANTITTTNQGHWLYCFKKWLVAMAACVLQDNIINHTVIVFSGKQGIGKTTWMENLVPQYLKNHLFSGTINPNNKDTLIHLSECMLINLDELENLNRTEIGSLKEIITKTHIRVRKAYGHNNETLPRRASFVGSVNTAQFLNDTTGSRRFLCFEVTNIEYHHNISIDNVYAQALHLFKTGFRYWFDKSEIEAITANNEQYQIRSVEEELLLTWFEPVSPFGGDLEGAGAVSSPLRGEAGWGALNATQIAARLAEKAKITITDGTIIKLGKALKKHGFQRIRKGDAHVYAVRELSWDTVNERNKNLTLEENKDADEARKESKKELPPPEISFPEDNLPF